MSDENKDTKGFDIEAFKSGVGTLARPNLFTLSINGYELLSQNLVHIVELNNDLIDGFTVYENEEGEMTAMLLDLQSQCNPDGSQWRWAHPDRFGDDPVTPVEERKPGVLCTLTRFRKDGTAYITRHYRLDEITFSATLNWDEANKIFHHVVYVGHCEKI